MGLPTEPVTLTAEQLADLNRKLAGMCHDIRNSLSMIVAATELIRQNPALADRMMARLAEQPNRIAQSMDGFRAQFEEALGITRS
jgi:signal transduction histidine kinase